MWGAKSGRNGCVVYISRGGATPRPFSASPWGVGLSWRRSAHRHQQPGPRVVNGPGRAAHPAAIAYCPPSVDFRHIHNNYLPIARQYAENPRLNATNYLFCCVRLFSRLLGPGIRSAKADFQLNRTGLLAIAIRIRDTVAMVLFQCKDRFCLVLPAPAGAAEHLTPDPGQHPLQ